MLLNGVKSSSVSVTSDVLQGTVLGPLGCFCCKRYYNWPLRIFADDCLLYAHTVFWQPLYKSDAFSKEKLSILRFDYSYKLRPEFGDGNIIVYLYPSQYVILKIIISTWEIIVGADNDTVFIPNHETVHSKSHCNVTNVHLRSFYNPIDFTLCSQRIYAKMTIFVLNLS